MLMAENKICAEVGKQLEKHYPGWTWLVECVWSTGLVTVKNLNIHGDYGFVLTLQDLLHDVELVLPVRAGGELLERCNLPRARRPQDTSHLKRDVRGNVTNESADFTVTEKAI
jgi:hypothetical protein